MASNAMRAPLFRWASAAAEGLSGPRMNFAFRWRAFSGARMEPGSLRVVVIDDQRWVVRAVRRVQAERALRPATLRFFNGAESRYTSEYPEDWPVLPESELASIFERAEPIA
jgi:hypothetical protein